MCRHQPELIARSAYVKASNSRYVYTSSRQISRECPSSRVASKNVTFSFYRMRPVFQYPVFYTLIALVISLSEDSMTTTDAKLVSSVDHDTILYKDCADQCHSSGQQMECIDCIPRNVSSTVNEIVISQFNGSRFVSNMFCGVFWPQVVKITILNNDNTDLFYIKNFTFSCLSKIINLKLGLQKLTNFSHNALYGLDSVQTLDLTDCIRLEIPGLTPALSSSANVPRLQTLVLSNVGTAFDGIQLSQDFVDILAHRNISSIDISASTVGFTNSQVSIKQLCKSLKRINLAYSILTYLKLDNPPPCDSLQTMDMSGAIFPNSPIYTTNISVPPGCCPPFHRDGIDVFRSVSKVYLNKLISTEHYIYIENATLNIQVNNNSIHELHVTGYNIPVLEVKLILEPNHVTNFDISNNRIERVSPD